MKDYWNKHKKPLLWTAIAFVVIFITSFLQSLVQSAGFSVTVTDLRNATNEGVVQQRITYNDDNDPTTPDIEGTIETAVKGEVVSGLLFKPKAATSENKRPSRPYPWLSQQQRIAAPLFNRIGETWIRRLSC